MILDNYFKLISILTFHSFEDNTPENGFTASGGTKYALGSVTKINASSTGEGIFQSSIVQSSYTTNNGIIFGTGDTPPTFNDYKLSGDIIQGLTAQVVIEANTTSNGCYRKFIITVQNTTSEAKTIREIGYIRRAPAKKSDGGTKIIYPLVERTVLDNPVTIPANGFGQVEYTITFNFPTAT